MQSHSSYVCSHTDIDISFACGCVHGWLRAVRINQSSMCISIRNNNYNHKYVGMYQFAMSSIQAGAATQVNADVMSWRRRRTSAYAQISHQASPRYRISLEVDIMLIIQFGSSTKILIICINIQQIKKKRIKIEFRRKLV